MTDAPENPKPDRSNGDETTPSEETKVWKRGQGGRFAKGNVGGPGNPHLALHAEYHQVFKRVMTPEKVGEVCAKILAKAITGEGSLAAGTYILDRLFGKPKVQMEMEQKPEKSLEEMRRELAQRFMENPQLKQHLAGIMGLKVEGFDTGAALRKLASAKDIQAHARVITEVEEVEPNRPPDERIVGVAGHNVLHQGPNS